MIDPQGYDRKIVVQGRISDLSEIIEVRLNYTRPIDQTTINSLTNAEVWIEDDAGLKVELIEKEPGVYQSAEEVSGEVGRSYSLHFTTESGSKYASSPQELIGSPTIDSIYYEYAEVIVDQTESVRPGIQFFLDTHDDSGKAVYYRYDWEETYEVQAAFPTVFVYDEEKDTIIYREDYPRICYETESASSLIVKSSLTLSDNRLSEVDLRYITNKTDQLKYKYSLLAKQYVVSAEAYSFYRRIIQNNENTGTLFAKQLGAVPGNLRSLENPEDEVLGYFEVSGYSEKRIFVAKEDLDSRYPYPEDAYPCDPSLIKTFETTDSLRLYYLERNYGIVYYTLNKLDMAPLYCLECRFRGPIEKPDFWIY